jgi:transposase
MKIAKQAYTTEFKELAVKRVKDGQRISTVTKELGLGDQTLRNWVKASAEGKLKGAYGSPRMLRELRTRGFPAGRTADA